MRKNISKLVLLCLTVAMVFSVSFTTPTYAQTEFSNYIDFPIDIDGDVRYIGEKIPVYFTMDDVWTNYYTGAYVMLVRESDDEILETRPCGTVPANGTLEKLLSFKTKSLKPGTYTVRVVGVPQYSDGTLVEEVSATDWEIANFDVVVKTLKSPKSVKATAGKKKVTVTYKKAPGATKYQIYRSTKKNSGYVRVATTTRTKYVDKKVKKGKRYYYKVRSVRTETVDTVRSSFSNPVRSQKVKK